MTLRINMLIEWTEASQPPRVERVLWIDPSRTEAMGISITPHSTDRTRRKHEHLLPVSRQVRDIEEALEQGQARRVETNPYAPLIRPEEELTCEEKKQRLNGWKLIARLIRRHYVELFDPAERGPLIEATCQERGTSRKIVYELLRRYWQGGQTPNALLPMYYRCGKKNPSPEAHDPKRGRPSKKSKREERPIGINLTEVARAHIRQGLDRFYINQHLSVKEAYHCTMETYFKVGDVVREDGTVTPLLPPEDQLPTPDQFYSVYREMRDKKETIIAREGESAYHLRERPSTGNSTLRAAGPGALVQLDSTIGDLYLVSSFDRSRIIGRPVITLAIDVFTRLIVGFHVSLNGPSWETVILTLENMTANKVAFCQQYGIRIDKEDWPVEGLPERIMGDRGELLTKQARNVIRRLGIQLEHNPPYRADWKGIIEAAIRLSDERLIDWAPGHIHLTEDKRRHRDYRLDAALTIHQFRKVMIYFILDHNLHHYMEWYEPNELMIADHVDPYPIALWNWGITNGFGALLDLPRHEILVNLLPSAKASVSERGISFQGLRYTCARAEAEGWFGRAKRRGSWPLSASYYPGRTDAIYLDLNPGFEPERCSLLPGQAAYQGRDWQETWDYLDLKDQRREVARARSLQTHADYLAKVNREFEEGIEQTKRAQTPQSKRARIGSIPENKRAEHLLLQQPWPLEASSNQPPSAPEGAATPQGDTSSPNQGYIAPDQPFDLLRQQRERRRNRDQS